MNGRFRDAHARCCRSGAVPNGGRRCRGALPAMRTFATFADPSTSWRTGLLPVAIAAAFAHRGGIYGLWRRRRNRHVPPLLPFEIALQQLEEIRALMQPARAREFSTAVSDIVRRYIEQRFEVTATRRTTEEFLRDLLQSSNVSLARHQGLLGDFLYHCDAVKFAALSLTHQNMEILRQSARTFVIETAKPEEPIAAEEVHDSLPAT